MSLSLSKIKIYEDKILVQKANQLILIENKQYTTHIDIIPSICINDYAFNDRVIVVGCPEQDLGFIEVFNLKGESIYTYWGTEVSSYFGSML